MENKLKTTPKIIAHKGTKKTILLMADLNVPPNFKDKTKDKIKKIIVVAISQKIALNKPSFPKIPILTGYPINAVLAIIIVTKIDHNLTFEIFNPLRIKYEIIPVINEYNKITKGRTDNEGIKDKSAVYNAEKIMHGKKTFKTILLKESIESTSKKPILLRKYPKAIINTIDKIVIRIVSIKKSVCKLKYIKLKMKK